MELLFRVDIYGNPLPIAHGKTIGTTWSYGILRGPHKTHIGSPAHDLLCGESLTEGDGYYDLEDCVLHIDQVTCAACIVESERLRREQQLRVKTE